MLRFFAPIPAIAVLVLLILLQTESTAYAAAADCDRVLVNNIDISNTDRYTTLSVLSLVTKEDWESFKQSAGAGLDFPIEGIPVSAYADYDSFKSAVHKELSLYQDNASDEEHRSNYTSRVYDSQVKAWLDCIRGQPGLSLAITKQSDQSVVLILHSNFSMGFAVNVSFASRGGSVSDPPKVVGVNSETRRFFDRTKNASVGQVLVNGGGSADSVSFLWEEPKPANPSAPASPIYLSDLQEFGKTNLYAFGKDKGADPVLEIGGKAFSKGVYTHPSVGHAIDTVSYHLDKKYKLFNATIGLTTPECNCGGNWGHVKFHVYGDGVQLYYSQVLSFGPGVDISVPVSGVSVLTLGVQNENGSDDPGDQNYWDHAAWGYARLTPNSEANLTVSALQSNQYK